MEWLGLLVEVLLLALGVYVYLFARGVVSFGQGERAKKAAQFRQENGNLLRILALALMAIMFFNVAFSLRTLL